MQESNPFVSAYNGTRVYLIQRDAIARFVSLHKYCEFILVDVVDLFHRVLAFVEEKQKADKDTENFFEGVKEAWWELVNNNKMHSCVILDILVRYFCTFSLRLCTEIYRMAQSDIGEPRSIAEMIPHYLPERNIAPSEPIDNLIYTTVAIYDIYAKLEDIGVSIITPYQRELLPHALEKFGLFSEAIQVKASISLGMIGANGFRFDAVRARQMVEELTTKINILCTKIRENEAWKVRALELHWGL